MSLLDRYRKSGGFIQLLSLLETCTQQKRDKFLAMIKTENPVWESALRPRILTVDRVFTWSSVALTEILTRLQPLTIAVLYSSFSEQRRSQLISIINFNQNKQVKQIVEEKRFSLSDVNISIEKFLIETRVLITQGIIKLDKIDPDLDVPTDIEEKLSTTQAIESVNTSTPLIIPIQPVQPKPVVSETKLQELGYNVDNVNMPFDPPSLDMLLTKKEAFVDKESKNEIKKLREKVQELTQENFALKQENEVLKNKLEKIRIIA